MNSGKKGVVEQQLNRLPVFDPNPSAVFASKLLEAEGVPYALIGRVAMWMLLPEDQQELTKDVDFAVPLRCIEAIRDALLRRNMTPLSLPIGGLAIREAEIRIDFIDRREGGLNVLFEEAIESALASDQVVFVSEQRIPVVTVEYLVALKVVAAEPKDQSDAVRLLREISDLDLQRTREIIFQHGGPGSANLLDVLARQAGHVDARPAYRNGG